MTSKPSISRLRKWIGRSIWNDEGRYRAPSIADAHQWHFLARKAERESIAVAAENAKLQSLVSGYATALKETT